MNTYTSVTKNSLLSTSIIPTINGNKLACDIERGDLVFGLDGKSIKVLHVEPLGLQDVYCVEFSDDRKMYCGSTQPFYCIEHKYPNDPSTWNDVNTEVLSNYSVEDLIKKVRNAAYKRNPVCIPLCSPVDYSSKKFNIFPQVFGLLLFLSSQSFVEKIIRITPGYNPSLLKDAGCYIGLNLCTKKRGTIFDVLNKSTKEPATLKDFGIEDVGDYKESLLKELQEKYIYGSIGQRFVLIQGIMDCIGCLDMHGVFHTQILYKDSSFVDSFVSLLHSMGVPITLTHVSHHIEGNKEGVIINLYTTQNNINRLFGHKPIYTTLHKRAYLTPLYQFQTPCVQIKNITKENKQEELFSIKVDNSDNVFLGNDYIVLG